MKQKDLIKYLDNRIKHFNTDMLRTAKEQHIGETSPGEFSSTFNNCMPRIEELTRLRNLIKPLPPKQEKSKCLD